MVTTAGIGLILLSIVITSYAFVIKITGASWDQAGPVFATAASLWLFVVALSIARAREGRRR